MKSYRVVVVGGGILGAAVAYTLAVRGESDVVVLEAEPALNLHSTGRSAAYYIPMYESEAYASLAKASLNFLKNPPSGFADRPIFSQDGAVIAAIEGRSAGVIDEMNQARTLGIDVQKIEGPQIKELVPIARPELIEAAAFYPDAGEIDVDLLAEAYRRGAMERGVTFLLATSLRGVKIDRGKITGVTTSAGDISCEHIVNAAGAWAGEIARLVSPDASPMIVLRRHLLKTRVSGDWPDARWPFFRCPSLPLYYKQGAGELAFSPMDAEPDSPRDCPIDPAHIAATIASLNKYTTASVKADNVSAVAGHRVFGPDHGPVVGEDPSVSGFHWAAALGGSGVMAAPAVGDLVASGVLGAPLAIDVGAISPARFKHATVLHH